jgi:hypothetical protein
MCWKFLIRNGLYVVIWAVDASRLEMKTDKGLRHIVMPLFLLDNFCRYICDGRLEMRRERNEIVLNY